MLHVLAALAFTEGAWDQRSARDAITSAVITHAACAFLERFSNFWMSCRQANPLDKQNDVSASPLALARLKRRVITLEGAPLMGLVGVVHRLLVFAALSCFFVFQYVDSFGAAAALARDYWLLIAGGYAAAVLAHGGQGGEA